MVVGWEGGEVRGGKCAGVWEKSLTPVVEPGQNESR